LLTEERKKIVERWEERRSNYIKKIKTVKLILLGESIPNSRYFYDVNSEYNTEGLRYTMKKEFSKTNISDSEFLLFLSRKGIILYDCALCPLHKLDDNTARRHAATYCFLTITNKELQKHSHLIPIATAFPKKKGLLISKISENINARIKQSYPFSSQKGLFDFYNNLTDKFPLVDDL